MGRQAHASKTVADPDPNELLGSTDPDDRAFAAFLLGSADFTEQVQADLLRCLGDTNPEVVGFAAQSLALQGDVTVLSELVTLLDKQTGHDASPVAWAASVLAARVAEADRETVREALWRLRERGSAEVIRQVDILLGHRPGAEAD